MVAPAIDRIDAMIARRVETVTPFRAVVTAVSAGLVEIRRLDATTAETRKYARVLGFAVAVSDVVLVANLNGEPIVVGKIQTAAPASYTLDAPLIVPSLNTPLAFGDSQTSSSTASTTSTTLWSDAMTYNLALPAGTWTVLAMGFIDCLHSADNRAHIRVEINGDATGDANSPSCPATSPHYRTIKSTHLLAGIAGSQTIAIKPQFKSLDAGTTSANNPEVSGLAWRTA